MGVRRKYFRVGNGPGDVFRRRKRDGNSRMCTFESWIVCGMVVGIESFSDVETDTLPVLLEKTVVVAARRSTRGD